MSRIDGQTVLITGGAMGMGRRLAERCVERGAERVILWDIDAEKLDATVEQLRAKGGRIDSCVVDLCNVDQIQAAAERGLDSSRPVGILFNNAGIVVGKPFVDHSAAEIDRSIGVNLLGAMHTLRTLLPGMIERGTGHIVNIASAAGLTPNPNMSVYAASKWAVLGWSESLRIELRDTHPGIHVTTVCPSYVDTGMFRGASAPRLTPIQSPDAVVAAILRAVEGNRILLRTPWVVNLLPLLRGLLPSRWFDRLIGEGFGIYESMNRFVGRTDRP